MIRQCFQALLAWTMLAVLTLGPGLQAHPLPVAPYTFQLVDVPLASEDGIVSLVDINPQGDAVGWIHYPITGVGESFLRSAAGVLSPVACPGATSTSITAMNAAYTMLGHCDGVGSTTAFLYEPARRGNPFQSLRLPQATAIAPAGLNDRGWIVGTYFDRQGQGPWGFLRRHGHVEQINIPGLPFPGTMLYDVNNWGVIVGVHHDPDVAGIHGFLRALGVSTTFNVPGAERTNLFGVNDHGDIVGFADFHGEPLISVLYRQGVWYALTTSDPGIVFTDVAAINNDGIIVGRASIPHPTQPGNTLTRALLLVPTPPAAAGLARASAGVAPQQAVVGSAAGPSPWTQTRLNLTDCTDDAQQVVPMKLRALRGCH